MRPPLRWTRWKLWHTSAVDYFGSTWPVPSGNRVFVETLQQTEKARTRRPWLVIGIIISALLLFIGCMIFMDDAPPDDAWLLPKIPPESAEKNPLVVFCETLRAHPIEGYDDLIKVAKEFKNISTEDMRAFVEKHALQSEAFDKLMQTDPATWRWPGLNQDVEAFQSIRLPMACHAVAMQFQQTKTELLVRAGNEEGAVTEALKTTRFGYGISGMQGFLIHWTVGIAGQRSGETGLRTALILPGVGEKTLRRAQETLLPLLAGSGQVRQILSWEYLGLKNSLLNLKSSYTASGFFDDRKTTLMQFFLRKNRALGNYLALMRPVYEAAGKDWSALLTVVRDQERIVRDWRSNWFRFTINPNFGGNIVLESVLLGLPNILEKAAANFALSRQVLTMIALRRYELAEGKLPEKLDALVPKYLPAVPLDPFDNAPMRWDSASGVLYSVGSDFKDDGGRFTDPYKSDNKDVGMRYWWKL